MQVSGAKINGIPVLICPTKGHIEKLRRVSHATPNLPKGLCYFPAYLPFLDAVLNDLKRVFKQLHILNKAQELIDEARHQNELFKNKHLDENFNFKTKPFAHQLETLLYAIYHPRCGLLLDCGLGKSKIAVDLINYLNLKALILCPSSLITNWVGEFEVHSNINKNIVHTHNMSAKKKKKLLSSKVDSEIFIVGYDTAGLYYQEIYANVPYDIIIADESHKIKGHSSRRTKAACVLSQKCHRRVIMSGTLVVNIPADLYSQLKFLAPQIINQEHWHFMRKYHDYSPHNKHQVVGVKNLHILNKKVRNHTIVFKKDDCLDLPKRHVITRYVHMTDEQLELMEDLKSDEDLYIEGGVVPKEYKLVALNKLNQVTGGFLYIGQKDPQICDGCEHVASCVEHRIKPYTRYCKIIQKAPEVIVKRLKSNPKLDMTMELVDEILNTPENKIIIWAKSLEELAIIEESLTKKKIGYVRISKDAKSEIKPFINSPKIRVLVSNIALGVGFTANAANYVIYFSLSFSLEAYLQSIDRNYRIGQDRSVTVYHILAKHTIDERVIEAINRKVDIAESLLNNMECTRCKHIHRCSNSGVKQYEEGCIYSKSYRRDNRQWQDDL